MSTAPFGKVGVVSRDVLVSTSGLEFLRAVRDGVHPAPPYAATSGIWISDVEHGRVVFSALPSQQFYNPLGTIHGGWVSGLLDSAMACAVHTTLEAGQGYTTLEFKVNMVRAMTETTGQIRAEGRTLHVGRRSGTAEGRIVDAKGTLLAHGTTTCIIFPL